MNVKTNVKAGGITMRIPNPLRGQAMNVKTNVKAGRYVDRF